MPERVKNPVGNVGRCGFFIVEQHGEFVAAQPRDSVRRPQTILETSCNFDQKPVSGRVTESVVHCLEVVEVDEEHGRRSAAAHRSLKCVLDAIAEQHAVRKIRQRIMECLVSKLLLELLSLGDVMKNRQNTCTPVVSHRHRCHFDVEHSPLVDLAELHFDGRSASAGSAQRRDAVDESLCSIARDEPQKRHIFEGMRITVSEQRRACGIAVQQLAFCVQRNRLRRMLDEISEPRFALLDRFGSHLRVADVAHDPENLVVRKRIDCSREPDRFAMKLERIFDLDLLAGTENPGDRRKRERCNRCGKNFLNAAPEQLFARAGEKLIVGRRNLMVAAVAIDDEEHFRNRVEQRLLLGRLLFDERSRPFLLLDCSGKLGIRELELFRLTLQRLLLLQHFGCLLDEAIANPVQHQQQNKNFEEYRARCGQPQCSFTASAAHCISCLQRERTARSARAERRIVFCRSQARDPASPSRQSFQSADSHRLSASWIDATFAARSGVFPARRTSESRTASRRFAAAFDAS